MICQSSLYKETYNKKCQIEKEFSATKPVSTSVFTFHWFNYFICFIAIIMRYLLQFQALEHFPEVFDHIKLEHFMHAYALG